MRNHNIGSVSSGTLRPEDLLPTFINYAESETLSLSDRKTLRKIAADYRKHSEQPEYWENDAEQDLSAVFDILQNCAPPYFYFGAHEGDGADYGFWLSHDFENDFEGLKVNDTSEIPNNYTGEALHVNDHGNMTLYRVVRGRLYELWAIV